MTPDDKDKITDSIMDAFDSMAEEGAEEGGITEPESAAEPEVEESEPEAEGESDDDQPEEGEEVEEVEVVAEGDPGDEQPEEPEGDEEEGEEGEVADEPEYAADVQAFIDRHDGDLQTALRSAVEMQKMLGRRNQEQGELTRRIVEMEAQLAQARAFDGSMGISPEQAEWVEAAVESEQPGAYIQSAVAAGEFDLARAICDAWGENGDAYTALRTRQMVDEAESAAVYAQRATEPPPTIPQEELFGMIQEQVPDFSDYWAEMTEIVTQLGPDHPMVTAAKSNDPNEAAGGLIDIYKVARTRKTRVSETRKTIEAQQREQGVAKRKQARVSSASSRSSTEEPPRPVQVGPGLTLDELDAAFAAE